MKYDNTEKIVIEVRPGDIYKAMKTYAAKRTEQEQRSAEMKYCYEYVLEVLFNEQPGREPEFHITKYGQQFDQEALAMVAEIYRVSVDGVVTHLNYRENTGKFMKHLTEVTQG